MRRRSESEATCLDVRAAVEYRRGGLRTASHKIVRKIATGGFSPVEGTVAPRRSGLTSCAISNPGAREGGDQPMSLAPEVC
jgi:hypothetical protein